MPVRNEEEHIRASLQSLLDQSYPLSEYEIIIIDGRSSDRTKQIIEEIRNRHPQVRCLDNPPGIVPTGMNIGIRAARGKIIVRVDGHSIYPRDYAANCIKSLEETKADNVGGPCMTVAADESLSARLVAAVLSNPFGVDAKNYYAAEVGFYRDYFGPISEQVNGASSFLDVGCGTGRLLELFVGRNLYRAGIELNHSRAEFARSVAKCEIFEQPIEEFSGQRFDAIGLINVLSHIPSLAGLFVKLKSLLSDHGKLIIKTGELQSHVKKAALHDWGIPDHLQFLGADTAAFIAQNYGLHLQICKRIPLSEEIFSLDTWTAKGRNPLRNAVKSAAVHLPGALRVMRSCYEFIHHESVMSSFLVFTNY